MHARRKFRCDDEMRSWLCDVAVDMTKSTDARLLYMLSTILHLHVWVKQGGPVKDVCFLGVYILSVYLGRANNIMNCPVQLPAVLCCK